MTEESRRLQVDSKKDAVVLDFRLFLPQREALTRHLMREDQFQL